TPRSVSTIPLRPGPCSSACRHGSTSEIGRVRLLRSRSASSRRQSGRPRRWGVVIAPLWGKSDTGAEPRREAGAGQPACAAATRGARSGELDLVREILEQLLRGRIDLDELDPDVRGDRVDLGRPDHAADRDHGVVADVERHAQHFAEVDLAADRLEADAARGEVAADAEHVALVHGRERDHLVRRDAPVLAALLASRLREVAVAPELPHTALRARVDDPIPVSADGARRFSRTAGFQPGGNRSSWRSVSPAGASWDTWMPRPRAGRAPAWVRPSSRRAASQS